MGRGSSHGLAQVNGPENAAASCTVCCGRMGERQGQRMGKLKDEHIRGFFTLSHHVMQRPLVPTSRSVSPVYWVRTGGNTTNSDQGRLSHSHGV